MFSKHLQVLKQVEEDINSSIGDIARVGEFVRKDVMAGRTCNTCRDYRDTKRVWKESLYFGQRGRSKRFSKECKMLSSYRIWFVNFTI